MNIINSIQNNQPKAAFGNRIAKKFAKTGEIGEGISIACDFLGKAVIVPAVIMKVSKEPKEKKEYSAFKNPVAATIQLGLEVPVLIAGSKIVEKLADKGYFDKENSDFSYNQKKCKEEFVSLYKKINPNGSEVIEKIEKYGYSKHIAQEFSDSVKNIDDFVKKELTASFKKFEAAYKNQFHLKNRICFLCALILTPILCAIENYVHPKVMNKIYNYEHSHEKNHILKTDIDKFIANTRKKNIK